MENIREIIEQEFEKDREKYGRDWEDWSGTFFNNYSGNLPFGYRRECIINKKASDIVPRWLLEKMYSEGLYSKKRLDMTQAEFFKDIDDTILELGLSFDEFRRLEEESRKPNATYSEINKYSFGLYIRLREKGYSRADLTG